MANHYIELSAFLKLDKAQVAKAMEIYNARQDDETKDDVWGFAAAPIEHDGATGLWMGPDESTSPDDVIEFVKLLAKEFGLTGKWGFCWCNRCDKARIGEFGGGAAVIDLATGEDRFMNTYDWLEEQMKEGA